MKNHISNILGIKECKHELISFVDIDINNDQRVFIDPVLISRQNDKWCKKVSLVIDDFFRVFFDVYRRNEYSQKYDLLKHAGEINYTKLGYGDGSNGHGNTADGLIDTFQELENLVQEVSTVSNVIDLSILIKGFNEDGLSDLITNIVHNELNDYTLETFANYGFKSNGTDVFYSWDLNTSSWKETSAPCVMYEGKKVLLTPKIIVRKQYLFSADHYIKRVILERKKEESSYINDRGDVSKVPKTELIKEINKDNEFWRYEYLVEETINDNSFLSEYHRKVKTFYYDKGMSDDELDNLIY